MVYSQPAVNLFVILTAFLILAVPLSAQQIRAGGLQSSSSIFEPQVGKYFSYLEQQEESSDTQPQEQKTPTYPTTSSEQQSGDTSSDDNTGQGADNSDDKKSDELAESEDSKSKASDSSTISDELDWLGEVKVGYDGGFVIASQKSLDLDVDEMPFRLRLNGWGQLRHTVFESDGASLDANQFQLKRGRLIFSGSAFTTDFSYFFQMDGRSSSGDDVRLLDYFLAYDVGHHRWGLEKGTFGFKTGKYKMPFSLARYLSGRELEFSDRSMASTYFDVNRSLAWGLYGESNHCRVPLNWEAAIFNGLITGGAETGSSGNLDDNFAYSARVYSYPIGDWGNGQLADFEWHDCLATRVGVGFANSTIDRSGSTEFSSLRVVDSGSTLASILPASVDEYSVNLYSIDMSMKYRGWSFNYEYYLRSIGGVQGAAVPDIFDHGHWLQIGKFAIPDKLQLLARWSRVSGNSGTLGVTDQSSDEVAGGAVWYFRDQHAKLTFDVTHLDGAPINSSALDISPGDIGWLFRTQIQFAF